MPRDESNQAKLLRFPGAPAVPGTEAPAPLVDRSEAELLLLCRADSAEAFEVLATRHLPRLTRFCAKFLGDAALGEEVAQEVLLTVWTHRHRYRQEAPFTVWLFTLARNRCRNQQRGLRRLAFWQKPREERRDFGDGGGASAGTSDAASLEPGALDALIEREQEHRVRAALLELPEKLREALLLRFDQGLNYEELAQVAGTNASTARSRVFHGLKKLRLVLDGGDA